jgi:hypothetical protein
VLPVRFSMCPGAVRRLFDAGSACGIQDRSRSSNEHQWISKNAAEVVAISKLFHLTILGYSWFNSEECMSRIAESAPGAKSTSLAAE